MMTSSKPYLINALYQWIADNEMSPYLLVDANFTGVMVPEEYVRHGEIILNISEGACKNLNIETAAVTFVASFSGIVYDIVLPMEAILAIYSHENGKGMSFTDEIHDEGSPSNTEHPPLSIQQLTKQKEQIKKLKLTSVPNNTKDNKILDSVTKYSSDKKKPTFKIVKNDKKNLDTRDS
jgi:stringent starvation protein B